MKGIYIQGIYTYKTLVYNVLTHTRLINGTYTHKGLRYKLLMCIRY